MLRTWAANGMLGDARSDLLRVICHDCGTSFVSAHQARCQDPPSQPTLVGLRIRWRDLGSEEDHDVRRHRASGVLSFGHVLVVTVSAAALIGILSTIDTEGMRHRLAGAPSRLVGGTLVVIGVAAYAGLVGNALPDLGDLAIDVGFQGQWAVDMALGTPVLLVGGVLLWRRAPLGFATAPGLLLVSGLGGVAFAAAALFEQLLTNRPLEALVIGVHLTIAFVSLGLLTAFLRHRNWPRWAR